MYARLVMFTLGQANVCPAEKLADQFASALKTLKGFKSATFFGDNTVGEYGGLSLWESKEDAEAALATTGSELKEALSGVVKGQPKRGVYEVWKISEAN